MIGDGTLGNSEKSKSQLTTSRVFYIQLIVYGAFFPVFYFFLEETRHEVILRRRVETVYKETGRKAYTKAQSEAPHCRSILGHSISRPIRLFFTEPVIFFGTLWSAFSLGLVFLFTQSVEQVFTELYNWAPYSAGYVQGAVGIGELIGWIASLYSIRLYNQSASRNTEMPGRPIPEARLYVSVFASYIGIAGGMLFYGWTSFPYIHWSVPAIGLGMVGFGTQIVVGAVADYIEDAYAASDYAASGLSAVCSGENLISGFLPLASRSMYTNLGFQWASTLIGILAFLLSFAPVVAILFGRQLRERSQFMQSGGKRWRGEAV